MPNGTDNPEFRVKDDPATAKRLDRLESDVKALETQVAGLENRILQMMALINQKEKEAKQIMESLGGSDSFFSGLFGGGKPADKKP